MFSWQRQRIAMSQQSFSLMWLVDAQALTRLRRHPVTLYDFQLVIQRTLPIPEKPHPLCFLIMTSKVRYHTGTAILLFSGDFRNANCIHLSSEISAVVSSMLAWISFQQPRKRHWETCVRASQLNFRLSFSPSNVLNPYGCCSVLQ